MADVDRRPAGRRRPPAGDRRRGARRGDRPAGAVQLARSCARRHRAIECCHAWPTTRAPAVRRAGCGGWVPAACRRRCGSVRSARISSCSGTPSSSRSPRTQRCARLTRPRACWRHGTPQHIERVETPAYAAARPEVSVIVTAVQLRRRGRRDAGQHRRQRGRRVRGDRDRRPRHRRQPSRWFASTWIGIPTCRWCCSARTPTKAWPRRATSASATLARRW